MLDKVSKSAHGNSFKDAVLDVLKALKNEGRIDSIRLGKRYGQFYAPFLVEAHGDNIIIFTTTSARSDRIKENQWDAWGIKNAVGKDSKCVLILPDELSEKERLSYDNEKQRIIESGYISQIDKIAQLKDLKSIFNLQ